MPPPGTPDPTLSGVGDTASPHSTPLGAFGTSILVLRLRRSTCAPPQTEILATPLPTVRLSTLYSRVTCPGWPHLGAATGYGVLAERPSTWGGTSQNSGRNDRVWGGRGADRPGRID